MRKDITDVPPANRENALQKTLFRYWSTEKAQYCSTLKLKRIKTFYYHNGWLYLYSHLRRIELDVFSWPAVPAITEGPCKGSPVVGGVGNLLVFKIDVRHSDRSPTLKNDVTRSGVSGSHQILNNVPVTSFHYIPQNSRKWTVDCDVARDYEDVARYLLVLLGLYAFSRFYNRSLFQQIHQVFAKLHVSSIKIEACKRIWATAATKQRWRKVAQSIYTWKLVEFICFIEAWTDRMFIA